MLNARLQINANYDGFWSNNLIIAKFVSKPIKGKTNTKTSIISSSSKRSLIPLYTVITAHIKNRPSQVPKKSKALALAVRQTLNFDGK